MNDLHVLVLCACLSLSGAAADGGATMIGYMEAIGLLLYREARLHGFFLCALIILASC